ncbi:uncharacterized protein LOC142625215 [Castanea sativa]|uniref:uncharacterized protein LOC142625215 n=1 Tax=Castanea sativa TaxID=21020 RepID=UPI003F6504E0
MDQPIKKSMDKSEAAGRMVQWVIELSQFDIRYQPKRAIKVQALADFIAEFTLPNEDKITEGAERWTIPRSQNVLADEVVKMASSEEGAASTNLMQETQKRPSIEEIHTFAIQGADIAEARKVRKRAARFTILNDTLYKRGFSMPYLKYVDEEQAKCILEEIHEGICGDHAGPKSLVDARELVKRCDKCQRFENVQRLPAEKLTTISSPWPFTQWGIDIVGSLPQGHPQANGQTEVTNRTLLRIIKVKLDDAKGAWSEKWPNVLWAYRTTTRTLTGETLFRLTYGTEAVIPVKVGITSMRREMFHEESNDEQIRVNLDCLDEVREKASEKMMKYQKKMIEYYNKRVKLR